MSDTPDKGSQMKCNKCETLWWTKLVGDKCPACDPKYARLKSTIRFNLDIARQAALETRLKIAALEEMSKMCDRLDSGL